MTFEEAGACGINKRKFEISMSADECALFGQFLKWYGAQGHNADSLAIAWGDGDDDERVVEDSEDFFAPMFKTLDAICDDIPDDVDFKPLVEEMTDEMAAYFEA